MSDVVSMTTRQGVAVITVDHPPVNALRHDVRAGLVNALDAARRDPGIAAIVIACAGRTFIAGADIMEFGKPPVAPTTLDVIEAIEASAKPVIAAMHGTALGGGLEVALACHFRIAAPATRLGLPEIKLGIIPGAGGTQRLPRLVGMDTALAMILTGDPIPAGEALEAGLIDDIAEGDLTAAAVAFAHRVIAENRPLVLAKHREERFSADRRDTAKFEADAAGHLRRARGRNAPAAAIEALRAALTLPVADALKRERALFLELVAGDQSKAQRHIFFAERAAAKVPDIANAAPHEVKRAAVIGAGTMGRGIAMCFANAGIPVTVVEATQDALARGLDAIGRNYRGTAEPRGRGGRGGRAGVEADEIEARLSRIAGATEIEAVAGADIVIEAVFEDFSIKEQVFAKLDRIAKDGAALASNTSYLDIDALARGTARPQAVVGMHFFSPAHVMRVIEVVRGAQTSPPTLATAIAVARKLGKIPVVVGVCHGFVGNRMLQVRSIEAERLLLEGALPQDVDTALVNFGFPMGPFAVADLAGLDVGWRMRQARGTSHGKGQGAVQVTVQESSAPIADRLCELGRFGQKTGRGFYLYQPASRTPQPDPEVERLIAQEAAAARGHARRSIGREEIVERLVFPIINEGARILDEGIARRSGDIDVIWVYGYGFPAWRGGPMYYAERIGLAHVRDRLAVLAEHTGDERHRPAPLLESLAASGAGFEIGA